MAGPGTEIAAAYVSLVPSARGITRGLTRELSGLNGAAASAGDNVSSTLHSRITSGFSRTVSELGRLAKYGGVLIAGGLTAAGLFGVKVAADFEQTRISFEGILGDVGKAKDMLTDLRNFANRTPFEFTGLADSAKNLLATGFKAEDIIPTMTTLGNVAATLGVGEDEIKGTVRALGQMKGKGKASAEELQQISEQLPGFSAIKAIADGMGTSVANVSDIMQSPGGLLNVGVDAGDAIQYILDGMEKFPGAAGAMDRQSRTLNGVVSTFKDTLSTAAIDFVTPYLPSLSSGVQKFSGWITGTAIPALHQLVDYISDHVIPTIKNFVDDALGAIRRWWDRNGPTIVGAFLTVGAVAGVVLSAVGSWIWDTALPALNGFRDWFVNNKTAIVAALAAIGAAFFIWGINAAFAAASTILANAPLFILIGLIALAAAGFAYAYTHSKTFKEIIDKVAPVVWATAMGFFSMAIAIGQAIGKLDELSKKIPGNKGGLGGLLWNGLNMTVPGLSFLASGGPAGPGTYVVGEEGPEILTLGQGKHGYVTPNSALAPAAAGGPTLVVQQLPGEDQVSAGMRALKWHQTIQMATAGR